MLAALMIVGLLALAALAVDVGYLLLARTQLQVAADAAAIAAAWDLIDEEAGSGNAGLADEVTASRSTAADFAALNVVCTSGPEIDQNAANDATGDVVVGYLPDLADPSATLQFDNTDQFNAVRIRVRKTSDMNGEVALFFARVLGIESKPLEAEALAALNKQIGGFRTPADGGNVDLLPFALDLVTWEALMNGTGTDNYDWSPENDHVYNGSDGIKEVNLYPQGTGSPGNRGTVDIGPSNNSTADIARQIVEGISPEDFDAMGGELEFNEQGELHLNGDTGISAGVKDELASIIGEIRMIPIFSQVSGPGNNADYTIVKFVGVRILYVKLTGSMSSKKLIVQPANVLAYGTIATETAGTSDFIYTPARLLQ